MSQRVVIDTSTLVSAALRAGSVPYQALAKALSSGDVCASEETLSELERVLMRPKFDRYLPRSQRRAFVMVMRRRMRLCVVEEAHLRAVDPPCRDPLDDKFLALALSADADVLISSDEDLLVLHPWRGMPVVTAGEFLARFGRASR